ncbi:MAG: hypothetical protein IKN72_00555 [Clostridia bacterium]|nr:hypothetical protein [Clostridia bacterium]
MENEKERNIEEATVKVDEAPTVKVDEEKAVKKEKKPMKKGVKALLWTLFVLAMIGLCLGLGALYLKKEGVKKTFEMPPEAPRPSIVELPEGEDALLAFSTELYETATTADDVTHGWGTAVSLAGELVTPFRPADNALAGLIRDNAAGQIAPLYAETVPELPLEKSNVLSAEGAEEGDNYIITFNIDPSVADVEAMKQSDIYKGITDLFASAATVDEIKIEPQSVSVRFSVNRTNGHLNDVAYTRSFQVTAATTLTDAYRALTDDGKATITVPYVTTQTASFNYYGAYFTQRQVAMKPGDEEYMPLHLNLKPDATDDDFTSKATCSNPDVLEVHDDGLMIAKSAAEEPVTVTVVLSYLGHEYTDTMLVYVTDLQLEVNTNG